MQTQTFPEDIFQLSSQLEDTQENADTIEKQADNIYSEYRTMMDAGSEYFSDPAAIFNGMLAILKDTTCDSIKIAVATPITKSLMNKYLAAYPADHLENLGVVGGNDGISYWGSSILLDMQSVEVCAYYKMKIDLPFLDLFEYQLKTTSSTRAWIGDGTHNDAKSASGETSKTDGASKTGRGVELDEQATGLPGFGNNNTLGIAAGGSVSDVEPESETSAEPATIDGLEIIDGKVGGKVPLEEYKAIRAASMHNADKDFITLGRYRPTIIDGVEDWSTPGPDSYDVRAGTDSAHFSLGNEWSPIQNKYELTRDDMFDYFNKPALDDAVNSNKIIRFSHDPTADENEESYLRQEWEYLIEVHHYIEVKKREDGFWYAE